MNNPIFLGIVNLIVPGLGYVILKERLIFGWLLLIGSLLYFTLFLIDPAPYWNMDGPFFIAVTPLGKLTEGMVLALTCLAFGYDAYDLARKKRLAAQTPVAL